MSETPFIELQSVDSTNNYARSLINASSLPERQVLAKHGTVIFTHEQLAGKGQRGKIWFSEKDNNIALSILLNPQPLSVTQQFQLSACIAVAVHDFFAKYAGENTKIKWPNDLYWQDRKAGGILIETIIRSADTGVAIWEWAIAGVGMNINQTNFSSHLANPVSLKQITGKAYQPVSLAKELSDLMKVYFRDLITSGFDPFYMKYNEYLYKRNMKIKLKKENRVFEGLLKKVTPTGQLVVQHSVEEEFNFGEVEWVF